MTIKFVGVGCLVLVAMWLMVIASALHAEDGAIRRAHSNAANLAAAFSEEVTHTLDGVAAVMEIVAERMRATQGDFDIHQWAAQISMLSPAIIQGGIIAPDGRLMSTTLDPRSEPIDLSDREHFRVHLDGKFKGVFIGKPVVGRLSKEVTIQVSRRVDSEDGRFLGVEVFSLAPASLTRLYRSVDLGKDGIISLIGLDDVIRARFSKAHPDGLDGVGHVIDGSPRPSEYAENPDGFYIRESNLDHVTRIYNFRRLASYPLVVGVAIPVTEIYATLYSHVLTMGVLAALATVLLCGLAAYLARESRRRAQREAELAAEHEKLRTANTQLGDERRKLELANLELTVSKEHAEAASRAKSTFLANMSHELRTPLNAVIGFSQIIKDQMMGPSVSKRYADYANDIFNCGLHLLEVISNILDVSKIEAGKVALDEEALELPDLVKATVGVLRQQADRKHIALAADIPETAPLIRGDRGKLRQVMMNLLSNAIKFTPEGGRVTVRLEYEAGRGIAIAVADTGIGMSAEEIPIALEPFQQIDNALTKRYEGTGIGLPLAKRLVELHGGTLVIDSLKGVGTTVRIRLPADRVMAQGPRLLAMSAA
jgi:signal transduction histidine kinase